MLRAALIGFGSTGKTTLFQLMTSARGDSARAAPGRTEATIGISKVPDARLDRLTAMYNPKKRVPATVEFTDLAAPGGTGGAKALVDVAGVQECRRARPRDPCLRRRRGPAPAGVDRSGARRAGDGRRADPGRPGRGRASTRADRKGSEEKPIRRSRARTRRGGPLSRGARRRPPAPGAGFERRRPEAAARLSVSLRQAAPDRRQRR